MLTIDWEINSWSSLTTAVCIFLVKGHSDVLGNEVTVQLARHLFMYRYICRDKCDPKSHYLTDHPLTKSFMPPTPFLDTYLPGFENNVQNKNMIDPNHEHYDDST
ncbi:hypothetical protein AVEN_22396-1 [Araneus ventricosus]|uniref:Uncharacterized protein n=1 Tax=Araneus ventricosus TaxID=182803 RepID=A0A4Y2IJ38_ARAVE|nr:hypothetical protein AVEN_22396-1 [Araneus ventricosus]